MWQRFSDRFQKVEEHPTLGNISERFEELPGGIAGLKVELTNAPPLPRLWFVNEAGTELIQFQQDRFVHNWRKVGTGNEYPRYEKIRGDFTKEFLAFSKFVSEKNLGEIVPDQCEVIYVNHIETGPNSETNPDLGAVLTVWRSAYSDNFLFGPEDVALNVRYVIAGAQGEPIGRLHIAAEKQYRKADQSPLWTLTLVARGAPMGEGLDGVLSFMDIGREWIVKGFTSITTGEMHKTWERRDDG